MHIKTEGTFYDIKNSGENKSYTWNYEVKRPVTIDKEEKVLGMKNDAWGAVIMKEFEVLRPKMYSYQANNDEVGKNEGNQKYLPSNIK